MKYGRAVTITYEALEELLKKYFSIPEDTIICDVYVDRSKEVICVKLFSNTDQSFNWQIGEVGEWPVFKTITRMDV